MSDQPPEDHNPNLPPYQPPSSEPGGYQVPSAPQPGGFPPPGGFPAGGVPPADNFPPQGGYPPAGGGYGYDPAMAGGAAYPESSQADVALGLSVAGLAVMVLAGCCFGPFGIIALLPLGAGVYMGHTEINAIDAGRRDPVKRGNANAARIVGAVGAGLVVLLTVVTVLFGIAAIATG